jgi:hypothetical protein
VSDRRVIAALAESMVYTRLHNELGHKRQNMNQDATKTEMKVHVGGLVELVKRVIELHP